LGRRPPVEMLRLRLLLRLLGCLLLSWVSSPVQALSLQRQQPTEPPTMPGMATEVLAPVDSLTPLPATAANSTVTPASVSMPPHGMAPSTAAPVSASDAISDAISESRESLTTTTTTAADPQVLAAAAAASGAALQCDAACSCVAKSFGWEKACSIMPAGCVGCSQCSEQAWLAPAPAPAPEPEPFVTYAPTTTLAPPPVVEGCSDGCAGVADHIGWFHTCKELPKECKTCYRCGAPTTITTTVSFVCSPHCQPTAGHIGWASACEIMPSDCNGCSDCKLQTPTTTTPRKSKICHRACGGAALHIGWQQACTLMGDECLGCGDCKFKVFEMETMAAPAAPAPAPAAVSTMPNNCQPACAGTAKHIGWELSCITTPSDCGGCPICHEFVNASKAFF